ncbi:hypothetical protein [Cellulosimicrobium arenosum]|uniref:WxL domain-containing protein n=1 Tax=Cellulosimicrobium arenosum TaxID=2708133 RepID=A0A927G707_9MICO|nr:hypothetical protein [Cellulosimicrobium arenosum]MBD8078044.1 hypothetical protein [Cellulosimicrobium arenosum]
MNARAKKQFVAGGALGAMLIGTVALGSAASADPGDTTDVEVSVSIESTVEPGNLAMSVAADSTSLDEVDTTVDGTREFTGTLPTVTVTDTRAVEEVPEGAFWAVLGQATDFMGSDGQDAIGAENLGWAPMLEEAGESGLVEAGEEVDPALEGDTDEGNNVGLVDQELLVSTFDSTEVNPEGSWSANADLTLRTAEDVEGGDYSSTLTLSLFE